MKYLYRSKNRLVAGVCGGLAEYFAVDPTVMRLGYAFLTVITGFLPFVVLYVLAAIIMPEAPNTQINP